MEQNISNTAINSRRFTQSIETNIVQLARTLAIEHQLPIEPEAKSMARRIVQNKLNQLYTDEELATIKDFVSIIEKSIRNKGDDFVEAYNVIKLLGLDNAN